MPSGSQHDLPFSLHAEPKTLRHLRTAVTLQAISINGTTVPQTVSLVTDLGVPRGEVRAIDENGTVICKYKIPAKLYYAERSIVEPSYIDLKTLHWLRKLSAPLVCRGFYWTFESRLGIVIGKETIASLLNRRWIERLHRTEDQFQDDWTLSSRGNADWSRYEERFRQMLRHHIDGAKTRSQPRPHVGRDEHAATVEVTLAQPGGVWVRRLWDAIMADLLHDRADYSDI